MARLSKSRSDLEGDVSPARLRERALRLLAQREHSRRELRQKLGVESEQVEALLDDLVRLGYQDDARYAEAFVRSRRARGQGCQRILADLLARGVERSLAWAVLGDAPEEELEQAQRLAGQRLRSGRSREQTFRFLVQRGFAPDVARRALTVPEAGFD